MTKTKKSVGLKLLLCVMFVACFMAMFVGFGTTKAYAATTPKYTMTVSGSLYSYTYGGGYTSTITDQTSVSVKTTMTGNTEDVILYIYGSSSSGTGTLSNGGYIKSSSVNITSSVSSTITLYNSTGTNLASGSSISKSLSDGQYRVVLTKSKAEGAGYTQWGYTLELSSYFYVDSNAPTISGASTSTTGKYTKDSFTVVANDSASGVKALYYKAPNASSYSSTSSTSKTFSAGSTSGLYSFYAVDNAGNQSSTYYVMYDATAPTGTLKSSSGSVLTTSYTNGAFSYSASDSHSGISYLQYKTPSSSSWTTYTSGTTISTSATNGKYSFRAVDKAGNTSAEQYVYLDTTKPTGTLYGGSSSVSNGATTKESYVKFVPSDSLSGIKATYVKAPNSSSYVSYTSGSQLVQLGTYSFYSVDNANNQSATYTVTLAESHVHSYTSSII